MDVIIDGLHEPTTKRPPGTTLVTSNFTLPCVMSIELVMCPSLATPHSFADPDNDTQRVLGVAQSVLPNYNKNKYESFPWSDNFEFLYVRNFDGFATEYKTHGILFGA